jgi:hypothetical protein
MGIFGNLFGRTGCAVCGGTVEGAEGGKILMTSGDVTSASSKMGKTCNGCNAIVHFHCNKLETRWENGLRVTKGYCPKCGEILLTMMKH